MVHVHTTCPNCGLGGHSDWPDDAISALIECDCGAEFMHYLPAGAAAA